MIEAVIWDFGGVFTASPFEAFAQYERQNQLPADFIRRLNATNHLDNAWARFERAELDLESFDAAFAEEAGTMGHRVQGKDIVALLGGGIRPEMLVALKCVKTRFKTGCITNNVPSTAPRPGQERTSRMQEAMALFDCVLESSKLGVRKPDPRIYESMCRALRVPAQACVYLDDLGVNLKPARAMGMRTIKVESGMQAIAELERALGMHLRADP